MVDRPGRVARSGTVLGNMLVQGAAEMAPVDHVAPAAKGDPGDPARRPALIRCTLKQCEQILKSGLQIVHENPPYGLSAAATRLISAMGPVDAAILANVLTSLFRGQLVHASTDTPRLPKTIQHHPQTRKRQRQNPTPNQEECANPRLLGSSSLAQPHTQSPLDTTSPVQCRASPHAHGHLPSAGNSSFSPPTQLNKGDALLRLVPSDLSEENPFCFSSMSWPVRPPELLDELFARVAPKALIEEIYPSGAARQGASEHSQEIDKIRIAMNSYFREEVAKFGMEGKTWYKVDSNVKRRMVIDCKREFGLPPENILNQSMAFRDMEKSLEDRWTRAMYQRLMQRGKRTRINKTKDRDRKREKRRIEKLSRSSILSDGSLGDLSADSPAQMLTGSQIVS